MNVQESVADTLEAYGYNEELQEMNLTAYQLDRIDTMFMVVGEAVVADTTAIDEVYVVSETEW